MPNLNYKRSRSREYYVFHKLEEEGWLTFRTSGSHGVADVIAIRPVSKECPDPSHYEVLLVQIKVSEKIKIEKQEIKVIETENFPINVNFSSFPVKSAKYYAKYNNKSKPKNGTRKPKARVSPLKQTAGVEGHRIKRRLLKNKSTTR